ncbi:MAG: hypothetical protein AB2807_05820 [Candidatus Sedimenticola endophacoides]
MGSNKLANPKSQIQVRNATTADVDTISELTNRIYAATGMPGHSRASLRGTINRFPQGQFVITVNGKVVGFCATFILNGKLAFRAHNR